MHRSLILKALLLVIPILALHLLAYKFYLYASIGWYDMMMHTLGGVFIALLIGSIFAQHLTMRSVLYIFGVTLVGVFIIGFAWEIFEYIVQGFTRAVPFADIADSISDLVCDMGGAVVGSIFVIRASRRYTSIYEPVKEA